MDDAHKLDVASRLHGCLHAGEVRWRTPRRLDARNLASRAFRHLRNAFAEVAADADYHLVARLH